MGYESVFRRYEVKFFLNREQKELLMKTMAQYMRPDRFPSATIRNVYWDTDSFRLIRRSLEKPVYKEKLRLRSYRQCADGDEVFVELKKKYKGVVYKRRLTCPQEQAVAWLQGGSAPQDSQIAREITYFRDFYGPIQPKVVLFYDRQAFYGIENLGFRVTFDENICFRRDGLSLQTQPGGTALLPQDRILMEIKCLGAIPLWMARELSRLQIYKTSFSKYGTAYREYIIQKEGVYFDPGFISGIV